MNCPTLMLGDDGSVAADIVWLGINCHMWAEWRLQVVTAELPTTLLVAAARSALHGWQPPNQRSPWTESRFVEVTSLPCELDPQIALSGATDLWSPDVVDRGSPRPCIWADSRVADGASSGTDGRRSARADDAHDDRLSRRLAACRRDDGSVVSDALDRWGTGHDRQCRRRCDGR